MKRLRFLMLLLMITCGFKLVAESAVSQEPEVIVITKESDIATWDDLDFDIDDDDLEFTLEDLEKMPDPELTYKDYIRLFIQGAKYKTSKVKEHVNEHRKKYMLGLLGSTLTVAGLWYFLNKKKCHDQNTIS